VSSLLNNTRPGGIVTYSGLIIEPLNPDPELINIEDIAHALSNMCRFTGHVRQFYSVAQHSVYAGQVVSEENRMWALLHDASEAYLADIARPVKHAFGLGEVYREAEEKLMEAVAEKFGLSLPMPKEVHWADDMLLRSEQRDLMPDLLRIPGDDYVDFTIVGWFPGFAKEMFLNRFELWGG
jgi:uncharacterized protein